MISFKSKLYTINDFREWETRNELVLSPKFQRRSVWSEKAKSCLIDTVIRGLPIPKIFMRHDINLETHKSVREIIDGQQRITAILLFLQDGFKILKVHNKKYGNCYYTELPKEIQKSILNFDLSIDILDGTETQILDIFARLNSYTVQLNKQELINSKYFGAFKRVVYTLGYEFKNFWVKNGIMTEKAVARMGEAEFSSELVILTLFGIQDRKVIESYYKEYDDSFPKKTYLIRAFKKNMDFIVKILGATIPDSSFSKKPLFYSLFGVIDHLRKTHQLKTKDFPKILSSLREVDNILDTKPDKILKKHFSFYDACTKHVTDLTARKTRHRFILKFINEKLK